jgi:uncharacterized membrane protein YfcA
LEIAGFSAEAFSLLFSAASIAGFIDTLAGGGGLITIPALIASGIPPLAVLGTNKLQATMGTATATYMMLKNKKVAWDGVRRFMFSAFLGSMAGAVGIQFVNAESLALMIPGVLLLVAVYFLIMPRPRELEPKPLLSASMYQRLIVPTIGCYDGMFGPGTGSFFTLAGVSLRGHGLIDATVIAKTLNFSTNIASLIVFLCAGKVVWTAGVVMMSGQLVGAWAGAHCLFKINPRYLRLTVVVVCLALLAKYGLTYGRS